MSKKPSQETIYQTFERVVLPKIKKKYTPKKKAIKALVNSIKRGEK